MMMVNTKMCVKWAVHIGINKTLIKIFALASQIISLAKETVV